MVLQLTRATKTKVLYFQFLAFLMFIFLIHAGLQAAVLSSSLWDGGVLCEHECAS
jgi:hypothetical protein